MSPSIGTAPPRAREPVDLVCGSCGALLADGTHNAGCTSVKPARSCPRCGASPEAPCLSPPCGSYSFRKTPQPALAHPGGMVNHHLLVTATGVNRPPTCVDLEWWFGKLVQEIGMEVLLGPYSTRCEDPGNEGVTGLVGITTSHASFHCWDRAPGSLPFFKFDLYSCRSFDPMLVIFLLKFFAPASLRYLLIDRDTNIIMDQGTAP